MLTALQLHHHGHAAAEKGNAPWGGGVDGEYTGSVKHAESRKTLAKAERGRRKEGRGGQEKEKETTSSRPLHRLMIAAGGKRVQQFKKRPKDAARRPIPVTSSAESAGSGSKA